MITPSFVGLMMNGLLTFVATIMLIINWNRIRNPYAVILLFLLAISIGIHSILHFLQETKGFNPLLRLYN